MYPQSRRLLFLLSNQYFSDRIACFIIRLLEKMPVNILRCRNTAVPQPARNDDRVDVVLINHRSLCVSQRVIVDVWQTVLLAVSIYSQRRKIAISCLQ